MSKLLTTKVYKVGTECASDSRKRRRYKKAQLSLTNPRDAV